MRDIVSVHSHFSATAETPLCHPTPNFIIWYGLYALNTDYEHCAIRILSGVMYEPTIKGKQEALGVDLVGGYYDAGDNVKYGLPMAFTITTLSLAAIFYGTELKAAGEMHNVHAAIRWGIDFFLKASHYRNRLYVQVGDPVKDHECWVRPENMKTPRTVLKINQKSTRY